MSSVSAGIDFGTTNSAVAVSAGALSPGWFLLTVSLPFPVLCFIRTTKAACFSANRLFRLICQGGKGVLCAVSSACSAPI